LDLTAKDADVAIIDPAFNITTRLDIFDVALTPQSGKV
jgi:hypothetical protein